MVSENGDEYVVSYQLTHGESNVRSEDDDKCENNADRDKADNNNNNKKNHNNKKKNDNHMDDDAGDCGVKNDNDKPDQDNGRKTKAVQSRILFQSWL